MERYLRVLRRPGALAPFLAAVVARLPVAMGPLGMVVLVHQMRGNYAIAGVITSVFAGSAAVGAPIWGRLMDRRGQAVVIGSISTASGLLVAALAVGAVAGAPDRVLLAAAAGAGLTFPPMSAAMRGAWRAVLASDVDRRAAYALDAVAVETLFVGGPLLLSLLLVLATPVVPLLVTAGMLVGGGVGYAVTGAARHWQPEPHDAAGRRGPAPLRDGAVVRVLGVATVMAIAFGLSDVSIAATAREVLGSQARVGILFAAIAGGSASGGLWYGSRAWKGPEHRRLPVTLAGFATGLAVLGAVLVPGGDGLAWPVLGVLMPVLFGTGLCIAPALIVLANLVDRHGAADRLGEAQAWLNTAFTSGSALGTGLAGLAVDRGGPAAGFRAAAAAAAVALLASLAGGRRWGTLRG